ncbi:hypothetical protein M9H77_16789 [Catharanthus roseus]|uniref:Uncharacterized protein n=1 Tax=Catharanthus roseus TaxID=4058 RepID=A0ACC0B2S9_CATRO|nr:hypothetical protein M9H77_16789 [Catharanthus roseus]
MKNNINMVKGVIKLTKPMILIQMVPRRGSLPLSAARCHLGLGIGFFAGRANYVACMCLQVERACNLLLFVGLIALFSHIFSPFQPNSSLFIDPVMLWVSTETDRLLVLCLGYHLGRPSCYYSLSDSVLQDQIFLLSFLFPLYFITKFVIAIDFAIVIRRFSPTIGIKATVSGSLVLALSSNLQI